MSTPPDGPVDTTTPAAPADAGAAQVDAPVAGAAPTAADAPGATTQTTTPQPTPPAQFGGAVTTQTAAPPGTGDTGYVSAKPLLATGDFGSIVSELAHLLAANGYPNKVATGESQPVLDDELMRLVRAFQEDKGIDPAAMQGEAAPLVRRNHEGLVDAATWRALHGIAADDVAGVHDHEASDELILLHRYPAGSFA